MSKKKTLSKASTKNGVKTQQAPYKAVLYPAVWGCISLFLCLVAFSYILTKTADPDKFIPVLCLVSVAISGAVCGIACKKICGRKSALSVVSGLLIIGILLVVSVFSKDVCESSLIYKSAIVVLCPAAAFLTCTLGKSRKKRTR